MVTDLFHVNAPVAAELGARVRSAIGDHARCQIREACVARMND